MVVQTGRFAEVVGGTVMNVAIADSTFAAQNGFIACPVWVGPGARYSGGEFLPPLPVPAPVPAQVSPLQMRMALRQFGLKPQVDAYVATLDEAAQEAWEFATEVRRTSPLIALAASGLGLSDEQVDELFRTASGLLT